MLGVASRCVVAKSMDPAMQQKQGRSALSHVINLLSCRYLPFRSAASGFYNKAGALFLLRRSETLRRAGGNYQLSIINYQLLILSLRTQT